MLRGTSEPALRLDGRVVPIIVRRYPQARGYRLRYDVTRMALLLSMPARGALRPALDWARTQENWVRSQIAKAPVAVRLVAGASIPLEGVEHRILWDAAFPRRPAAGNGEIRLGGPEEAVGARLLRWLKQRALATLTGETLEIAETEDIVVASVAVGDPRSRWGSCTVDGAIRYSWRLILAPPSVRRATVAHEVAHRLHMDHSPAFHAAHARLLGADPAPARAWLRAHGARLQQIRL